MASGRVVCQSPGSLRPESAPFDRVAARHIVIVVIVARQVSW
jgi:hypothetical protein